MSDLASITPSNWFEVFSVDFLSAWLEKYEARLVEYFDLLQVLACGETSDGTRVHCEAQWVFVDSSKDLSGVSKANVDYSDALSIEDMNSNVEAELTAILIGDVDGSYFG